MKWRDVKDSRLSVTNGLDIVMVQQCCLRWEKTLSFLINKDMY